MYCEEVKRRGGIVIVLLVGDVGNVIFTREGWRDKSYIGVGSSNEESFYLFIYFFNAKVWV